MATSADSARAVRSASSGREEEERRRERRETEGGASGEWWMLDAVREMKALMLAEGGGDATRPWRRRKRGEREPSSLPQSKFSPLLTARRPDITTTYLTDARAAEQRIREEEERHAVRQGGHCWRLSEPFEPPERGFVMPSLLRTEPQTQPREQQERQRQQEAAGTPGHHSPNPPRPELPCRRREFDGGSSMFNIRNNGIEIPRGMTPRAQLRQPIMACANHRSHPRYRRMLDILIDIMQSAFHMEETVAGMKANYKGVPPPKFIVDPDDVRLYKYLVEFWEEWVSAEEKSIMHIMNRQCDYCPDDQVLEMVLASIHAREKARGRDEDMRLLYIESLTDDEAFFKRTLRGEGNDESDAEHAAAAAPVVANGHDDDEGIAPDSQTS